MRALLVFALAVTTVTTVASAQFRPVEENVARDGETIQIALGDRFRGETEDGSGTLRAAFNAPEGTLVDLRVQSTPDDFALQAGVVMLALLDPRGDEVDLGASLWEGFGRAEIDRFQLTESGHYTFVIDVSETPGVIAQTDAFYPDWVVLGTLSGTVTNALTGEGIAGAEVLADPYLLLTDADGRYADGIPFGGYDVTVSATYFDPGEGDTIVFPENNTVLDVALDPIAPVVVAPSVDGDPVPGGSVVANANVVVLDGSTVEGFAWTQIGGTEAAITGESTESPTVDLGDHAAYKAELVHVLKEPPVGPEDLPPDFPPPPDEFPGGLQDRFQVVGMNPFSIEEAALVTLEVEVVTSSGTYVADVEVHTHLDWKPTPSIGNVGLEIPVLLYGKTQASYDWQLTLPDLSEAVLVDPTTQSPEFVPDLPGLYELTVTDLATGDPVTVALYAGNWRGVIIGQDADGRPVADTGCTSCHSQLSRGNDFDAWKNTGHAEIFTNNLNTSTHYGDRCFSCHTVGYDLDATNRGIDEAPDYMDFLTSGLINNPGDNWTVMLEEYPQSARLANIQCENCHGPQDKFPGQTSGAHRDADFRATLSSDMCATCHGEPLRHARFQQWQLSGHANYELAIDEGESGNCSRCHTANGFLTWLPILLGDEPGDPTENIEVTWTVDQTHPQTCQTCHDPHNIGTTSGSDPNATVRISGNTPPLIAGFTAYGVGKGATCMTCHNSRRGLRNDSTFDEYYMTSEAARAPHGSAQTDMLMGQNAYLVQVNARANHSFLTDTCVQCHMESTPPPPILSYNQSGTNHTFFARTDICAECHTGFEAEFIQGGVEDTLHQLGDLQEEKILDLMTDLTDAGNIIDLNGQLQLTDTLGIMELVFGEFRGRQAITVILTTEEEFGPYRMSDIDVLDGQSMEVLGQFYDFADPALIKAGWNWGLVHNDGSLGIHNPTWTFDILASSIAALDPLAPINRPAWADDGIYWRSNLRNLMR